MIAEFIVRSVAVAGHVDFQIVASQRSGPATTRISPDLAVCADCLAELGDPADRRYSYPYINCTNCGPRYSIVRRLPYDRANTTLAEWPLCPACRAEYTAPLDRRYHAQPAACPECGPRYRLLAASSQSSTATDPIACAAELLRAGQIVAIKGIGGYHLAADAHTPQAVAALRERKFRKEKAFAVMVRDLDEARQWARLKPAHERLLLGVERPIVLAAARAEMAGIAPDSDQLGLMLPYAPLHHLLFAAGAPSPLVLTSGNRSSEPIAYEDAAAIDQLSGIADALLIGERPIARRVDDSVVTVRDSEPLMLRRGRGYAPAVVCRMPTERPILALGGDLKNAITLVVAGQAIVSQHIGDLDDADTEQAFRQTIDDLLAMYDLRLADVTLVHDLHPQFKSTQFALASPAKERRAVQHHRAHLASVLAEREAWKEPVLGVVLDGTGYGDDGSIWGGELFVGNIRRGFERCGSLRPVPMPGGDAAARFPVQAAAAYLTDLVEADVLARPPFSFPPRYRQAVQLVARRVRCFESTSLGRLFDAAAALLGFTRAISYEGQAAMWLEHLARGGEGTSNYSFARLDHRPLLSAMIADRLAGRDCRQIAWGFHAAVAAGLAGEIRRLGQAHGLSTVALSGGVLQNDLLYELLATELADGPALRLFINRRVPPGDGGISLGQAAIAAVPLV